MHSWNIFLYFAVIIAGFGVRIRSRLLAGLVEFMAKIQEATGPIVLPEFARDPWSSLMLLSSTKYESLLDVINCSSLFSSLFCL